MSTKTEKLFARFQAIYGGRWTACYASEKAVDLAIAEWSEVVERMSDKQLSGAMAWAKTSCPWPPSIAEFLHAGLGITEDDIRRAALSNVDSWQLKNNMTMAQIDTAVRNWRETAVQELIDERLMPALEFRA